MRFGRSRFGRLVTILMLLASVAAALTTGSSVSAATTSVTIHHASCSTQATDYFAECHDNVQPGHSFMIGGADRITNSSGVATAHVTAGTVTVKEEFDDWSDEGQFIYCSVPRSGRVLYENRRSKGIITIEVRTGEKVVCDWYYLVAPRPQGLKLKLHSYQCPANTDGDIFTKCHRASKANAGTTFTLQAGAITKTKQTNTSGTFGTTIRTASTGWIWVTITQDARAVTSKGAFVFCSSTGEHPGSGDILGGITVNDGKVILHVQDGTSFTCDWYNRT